MPRPKLIQECTLDGCSLIYSAKGFCYAHYKRWKRYGDPSINKPIIDKSVERKCSLSRCDNKHYGNGFCGTHYQRNKFGTNMFLEDIPKSNSYHAVHSFIYKTYGPAPCCIWDDTHSSKRYEWANVSGNYTRNIEDYLPMCVSCHRKFDVTEETRRKNRMNAMGNTHASRKEVLTK